MRITLDTAILVRTNAKAKGPARELLKVIQQQGARLVLSPFLLEEVQRVLRYPRMQAIYHLDADDILEHVQLLESLADLVIPAEGPSVVLKDPNDDPVVYTALAGQADILCTVDRHFYEPNVLSFCARHGIQLMTDVELLRALRRGA
jgi:putative PIN family toxin of toxin-antitoxin system